MAAEREREVEIEIIGFGVRWQRVQVVDFARNIITVLVVVDARKLALVAAALVLAVGRMRARGAAVANFDAAGAERAAVFGENMSRRWRVVRGARRSHDSDTGRHYIGNPSCAQPICALWPPVMGASLLACAIRHDGGKW